ncbi:hypothetical protein J3R82DRAFT_7104 [Butyriboletus roseoflavus]|nr:hypothetical protein J3R82DRAFT_7104 [Butyriboletus roseoflavus]
MLRRIHIQNMYGLDPFSAQNAANDNPVHPPSIFGALPYPRSSAVDPPLHTLVTFRFTSTVVLDCTVVGPTNEPYYRLASAVSAQGLPFTLLKTAAGRNIALVEWQSHPTVEAQSVGPKQHVAQWLRLSSDRRFVVATLVVPCLLTPLTSSRTMIHGGVYYSWAPLDRFLHLFAPGSSEWLVRITKIYETVVLELTHRAIELGLIDVAVLATALLQCGKNID